MPPTPERVATPLRVAGRCACAAATACAVSGDSFTERLPRNASREVGGTQHPGLPSAIAAGRVRRLFRTGKYRQQPAEE